MRKRNIFLILVLITILGGFLRFYGITKNPPSLTGDEVSFGYAAYSILRTGKDESGKFLPLVIQSIGDYKNPLPAYLMVLSFRLFGVNDFAIRFQNAFFGTLAIVVYYFFLKYLLKKEKVALLGSFFLAISSWNILYSRFAYEPLIASFFAMLGIWFFMKMLDGNKKYAFWSAVFMVLTMYTGFAPRLFIPIFGIAAVLFNFKRIIKDKDKFLIFFIVGILLGLPLVYVSLFQGASTRFKMVFIANDINYVRYVIFGYLSSITDAFYLFFFWIRRYLNYLQPDFLFIKALNITLPGNFGLGILYLFELPFLIWGVIDFIKRDIPYKSILVIWLLTGLVPDSITNNEQHAGRLLHIAPVVILFTTLGAIRFYSWIKGLSNQFYKVLVSGVFLSFVFLNLIHAFLVYDVHFPYQKSESFDEGWREAILSVIDYQDKYDEVIFDIRRGVDAPSMVSNPFVYLLFYSKYDPRKYETVKKVYNIYEDEPYYHFDKYTFGYIEWFRDGEKENTLLVGSPWSFPKEEDLGSRLLKKIYLTNGKPAFYIVSSE